MEIEALSNLSWREGLIAIVVLLVVYLLVVFLRFSRLKREKDAASMPSSAALNSAIAAYAAVQMPQTEAVVELPPSAAAEQPVAAPAFDFPWNEPPAGAVGQAMLEAIERDLVQLRKEVGGLRAEVLVLREEQRREPEPPPVTQAVSPLYSDAMQMAIQGQDAASISHYCGISRAEAELVVALVRNRDNES
jgi:hypothetical protein